MKNTKAVAMILVSLVAALAAVIAAARWVAQQGAAAGTHVVVSAVDIQIGQPITLDMVRQVDWPAASVPTGAFDDPKRLESRVARTTIQRGEPVLEAKLAAPGTKGGLSAVVPEGMRAMTVKVNEVIGVAGFALPGNYVDIMVNTQEEAAASRDHNISKIVLEHILVLAVAQEASQDQTKPKVVSAVTLQVTPEEAEKLDLARSVGQLSLVLRNQIDPKPVKTDGATKDTLLALARPPVAATPNAPARTVVKTVLRKVPGRLAVAQRECVHVITGAKNSEECF